VLCAVLYDPATREEWAWVPGDPLPVLDVAVAHNATGFDRFAAEACGWRVGSWLDSSHMARRAGLPASLDALAKRWLGRDKDKEGNRLTLSLSRPSRAKARKGQLPDVTPEVLDRVIEYCANDVEVMAHGWDRLRPWSDVDADTCAVDTVINDRGVCLDVDLVRCLQRHYSRAQEQAVGAAAKALGWTYEETRAAAMSPQQLTDATGLPNAQKDTLKAAARKPDAHPLIAARQALASVVPGKLRAALECVSADGRMRDSLFYYGAHTGRWSSKGMQIHNLPRVSFEDAAESIDWSANDYVAALVGGALAMQDVAPRELSGLLRSVLVAAPGHVLGVLDYAGIEARGNAWAADDFAALDVFRALDAGTGPDPYKVMAADIFGCAVGDVSKVQRGVGKIAELAAGYGMGSSKFGDTAADAGVNLEALGVSAEDAINAWRTKHAPIVRMWRDCEKAFVSACEGRPARAGRWRYEPHGEDIWCVLPSGRPVVYCNAHARPTRTPWGGKGFDLTYQGARFREHLYGGKMVENAVQAFCRDLLADALVRFERDGLTPVLHIHDEGVCEFPAALAAEGLAEMRRIMSDAPEWADGLPIRLDGFTSERYRK
jgi:DNA polymerase